METMKDAVQPVIEYRLMVTQEADKREHLDECKDYTAYGKDGYLVKQAGRISCYLCAYCPSAEKTETRYACY